jgi:hypothetical protein
VPLLILEINMTVEIVDGCLLEAFKKGEVNYGALGKVFTAITYGLTQASRVLLDYYYLA